MNAIAIRDEDVFAIRRHMNLGNAPDSEVRVFLARAERLKLDPMNSSEILLLERQGRWIIQVGIAGLRKGARDICNATGEALNIEGPFFAGPDGQWREFWAEPGPPTAAKVTIHRGNSTCSHVILWEEYVQRKRDGSVTKMWSDKSTFMLGKCCEAGAIRKAFPEDMAGLYLAEEFRDQYQPAPTQAQAERVVEHDERVAEQPQRNEPPVVTQELPPPAAIPEEFMSAVNAATTRDELYAMWSTHAGNPQFQTIIEQRAMTLQKEANNG